MWDPMASGASVRLGDVGDPATEFAAMSAAFDRPALALLNRKWAPLVSAVFTQLFPSGTRTLPQVKFRRRLGDIMEVLASRGVDLPDREPLALCNQWIGDGWLMAPPPDASGEDVYELTAASLDALRIITDLSKPQRVNSSRVQRILDLCAETARLASGDKGERITFLENSIATMQAELDNLLEGGEVEVGTLDDLTDRYDLIAREVRSLPADFRRLREHIETVHKEMSAHLLDGEEGPVGLVLATGLSRASAVLSETAEGRSFVAVKDLLDRDPTHLRDLQQNARTILGHEFSEALTAAERRGFADVTSVFNNNIEMVMGAFRGLTSSVDDVTSRNVRGSSDRELSGLLRSARRALMEHRGDRIPSVTRLTKADINSIAQSFFDPDTAPPPQLLDDFAESEATPMSAEELAKWGGPHMALLLDHITGTLATAEDSVPLSRIWATSPESLRRAVELSGYLTWAVRMGGTFRPNVTETIQAKRPDGSTLDWVVPLVEFSPSKAKA
jgi:hypothetical protein